MLFASEEAPERRFEVVAERFARRPLGQPGMNHVVGVDLLVDQPPRASDEDLENLGLGLVGADVGEQIRGVEREKGSRWVFSSKSDLKAARKALGL